MRPLPPLRPQQGKFSGTAAVRAAFPFLLLAERPVTGGKWLLGVAPQSSERSEGRNKKKEKKVRVNYKRSRLEPLSATPTRPLGDDVSLGAHEEGKVRRRYVNKKKLHAPSLARPSSPPLSLSSLTLQHKFGTGL